MQRRLREKSLRALFVGIVLCVLATLLLESGGCDVSEGQLFNKEQVVGEGRANKTSEQDPRSKG